MIATAGLQQRQQEAPPENLPHDLESRAKAEFGDEKHADSVAHG